MTTRHLAEQVAAWAAARTNRNSKRYDDLIRDKTNILLGDTENARAPGFFTFSGKLPGEVTTDDVDAWRAELEAAGLAPATVYARVSRLSSFYDWLLENGVALTNPARNARPEPPPAYSSEKARPLTAEDVDTLLTFVLERANSNHRAALSAKRDNALLRFYFGTGRKRSEIINLRWESVVLTEDAVAIRTTEDLQRVEMPGARAGLIAYLKASDRWDFETGQPDLSPTAPLWLRHDRAAKGKEAVTSHGFVYMLKQYAKAVGLGNIHLNQARHTAALRLDSIEDAQRQLGYQSKSMTRAYLKHLRESDENTEDTPPPGVGPDGGA